MVNTENIGIAGLMIVESLSDEHEICTRIDSAQCDDDLKDAFRDGISELRKLRKVVIADQVETLLKGFI